MNATQTFLNVTPTASGLLEMRHGGVSQAPNAANYTISRSEESMA